MVCPTSPENRELSFGHLPVKEGRREVLIYRKIFSAGK